MQYLYFCSDENWTAEDEKVEEDADDWEEAPKGVGMEVAHHQAKATPSPRRQRSSRNAANRSQKFIKVWPLAKFLSWLLPIKDHGK